MKIKFSVDVQAAIRGGHRQAGEVVLDIDPSTLSEEDRSVLAQHVSKRSGNAPDVYSVDVIYGKHHSYSVTALSPTPESLVAAIRKAKEEAIRDAQAYERKADDELAAAESHDAESLRLKRTKGNPGKLEADNGWLNYAKDRAGELKTRNSPEWKAWEAEIEAANKEHAAAVKAAEEQKKQEQLVAVLAWVRRHGSARLKRCLEEGIESRAVYLSERLAKEYPGWIRYSDVPGKAVEPRNPPEEAFALLDAARQAIPDAELRYYPDGKVYCAYAEWPAHPEHDLVYFGDQDWQGQDDEDDE